MFPDRRSPTSRRASAPFIGYLATREPRPLDDRPPGGAGLGRRDDGTALDQFADVGEWEPMHRPLVKVMAVIVSISLVVAGVGTVLEILLSLLTRLSADARSTGAERVRVG